MVHKAVHFASHRKLLKDTKCLALVEAAIYCATVDRQTEILQVRAQDFVDSPGLIKMDQFPTMKEVLIPFLFYTVNVSKPTAI